MPTFEVTAPDGRILEVDAPEGTPHAQISARAQEYYATLPPLAPPEGGFIPAMKAGYQSLKGAGAQLAGRTGLMDMEEAKKYAAERETEAQGIFKPTQDDWSTSPWQKLKETAGSSVPYMAAPLAVGAAAAGLGAPALAAAGLTGLASATQFTATNLERQTKEGKKLEDTDLQSAALAAIPQAALDMVGFKMLPGIRMLFQSAGKEITKEAAEKIAGQTLKKAAADYAAATGKAMTAEGLTEAAQQVLERMQAGLQLNDEAARKEYLESLIGGAALGGVLSPAGRYVERGREAKTQAAEEQARATAEAEAEANKPKLLLENKPDPMISFPDGTVARQSEVEKYITSLPEDQQGAMRAKLMGLAPQAAPAEPVPDPLRLENKPEQLISFPDGSVGRRAEADAYIEKLPENEQTAARAKLMGLGAQPAVTPKVDEQAVAREAEMADLAEFKVFLESERRNKQVMQAQIDQDKAKQRQVDALHAQSAEGLGRTLDQRVAVKNAASLDTPNAMQLALQRAKDNVFLTPRANDVAQATETQQAKPQEPPAKPAAAEPVAAKPPTEAAAPVEQAAQEPAAPIRYGRNQVPMNDGGKPFKTNAAAMAARNGNTQMRAVRVKGGYALAEKSAAQLAAIEAAAKRLGQPHTSPVGEPMPAHSMIAANGGLAPAEKADMGMQGNVDIGNRKLFAAEGKGMTIEQATERLKEDGYLPQDATHDQARDLIKRSIKDPQHTPDGIETLAARELESRRKAAEQAEAEAVESLEELTDSEELAIDDANIPWDNPASNVSEADFMRSMGFTEQEIQNATADRSAIQGQDSQSSGSPDARAAAAPSPDLGSRESQAQRDAQDGSADAYDLSAPTREEVLARQGQTEADARADKAQRAAQQEQDRRERERKEIAQASERAADTFELGGNAEENLSGQKPMFSRASTKTGGQRVDAVRKLVDQITQRWTNAPEVVVAESMDDAAIPKEVRDHNRAQEAKGATPSEGFFHDGKVYLLADKLPTQQDVARVLAHETLGHIGLRGLFGNNLNPILDSVIQARNAEVRALAKSYGLDVTNQEHLREAAEEVLAAMAEKVPQAGLVKRAVGAVKAWLRENVPGFDAFKLSDNDIITQYILPARGFIERGNAANKTGKPVARYSRQADNMDGEGENNDRFSNPAGNRGNANAGPSGAKQDLATTVSGKPAAEGWASATRISREGRPITVFRGAKERLEPKHFAVGSLGKASGNPSSGLGVWFTTGKGEAQSYGNATAHQLDIRNPAVIKADKLPGFDTVQEAHAFREKLRKQGYDGIIITAKHLGKPEAHMVAFDADQVMQDKPRGNEDIRYSRSKIIGESKRTYSAEQDALFKRTGRTVDIPTMKERVADWRKDWAKKMTQAVADQFAPVKDLTKHGYTLLRLSRGSAGAIEAFLQHGKLKLSDGAYDADMSGGAIEKVFKPLQGEADDFLWWVAAHRAENLSKQDREHLFTEADIQAGKSLADGDVKFDYTLSSGTKTRNRTAIYKDTLKKFDGFNKNALDMAEQSGLIDGESRKFWEQEFYVPFYRAEDDAGTFAGANIKQGAVRQVAFQTLKGGKDKLHSDLLTNTLQNWGHLIDASAKNRAAKAVLDAAEKQGIASSANEATVKAISEAGGGKPIWIMDNGVKRHYAVGDEYITTALQALEYAGMKGPLWKALAKPKQWLTVGVTMSPGFKIRNLIRDTVQAMSVSDLSLNPAKNIKEGLKASKRDTQTYVSALASGGLIRFGTMLEGSASDRVRQLIKMGVDKSTILDTDDKLAHMRNQAEKILMAYNELGNRGEEINRAALYDQLIKKGISHAEASLAARDLLDFSMQGSAEFIRVLTQVVPFLNARIQGLYKLGRAARQDPARFSTVLLATAATSLFLLAQNHDDDDFKKLDDWQRDNFWWIKMGGIHYAIPKPFELGAIATLAERGVERWGSESIGGSKEMTQERFLKRVKDLFYSNLSMNPTPQSVKPLIDIYANKSGFTGNPIESMGMEKLKPEYRYNANTSMLARGASTAMNKVTGLVDANGMSPVAIDYAIQGYFGWLGSLGVGISDILLRQITGQPTKPTMDYYKFATQGMAQELPTNASRYVTQLYDQAQVVEQAYNTYRALLKEGKVQEATEFFKDEKTKIAQYKTVEKVKSQVAVLNQQIHMIERSSIDPDLKKSRIQNIKAMQNKMAQSISPL